MNVPQYSDREDKKAYIVDSDNERAELITLSDFGCISHETTVGE